MRWPWQHKRKLEETDAKIEKYVTRMEQQQPEVDRLQHSSYDRLVENHFTLSWEELMKGRKAG